MPDTAARDGRSLWDKGQDALRLAWTYGATTRASRRHAALFEQVQTYCMFVGYPRSGHSIVGSLLDAHPEAVIAHEASALQHLRLGFDRGRLFYALLANSERHAATQRRSGAYVYAVPGQWQGRVRHLRVIGDKKGQGANLRLHRSPGLLDRLRRTVGVPVRIVHVVRNPFDNIATMARRAAAEGQAPDLERAAAQYLHLCASAHATRQRVAPEEWIELRHEDFVARPAEELGALCEALGLAPEPGYLAACAGIVYDSPHRSRHRVPWPDRLRAEVQDRIAAYDFLQGYTFER